MKITADTITDEQIRELKSEAKEWKRVHGPAMATWDRREYFKRTALIYSARVALAEHRANRGDSRAKARARCAEILEARAKCPTCSNDRTTHQAIRCKGMFEC